MNAVSRPMWETCLPHGAMEKVVRSRLLEASWPLTAMTMPRLCCCQGPCLGSWSYHSQALCGYSWSMLQPARRDSQCLGCHVWPCRYPRTMLLLETCCSRWPELPPRAMVSSGPQQLSRVIVTGGFSPACQFSEV